MASKKDNFNIFLTWQNDVPNETNKDYIEECVTSVVDRINRQEGKKIFSPPFLGGSTGGNFNPIETTLLKEILEADVFFADLTSTEHKDANGNRKFQLNANVAYETGIFLGKTKGILKDSLIAVNNEAWVPTSNSPFDFRGRSQITYNRNEKLKGALLRKCTINLKSDIHIALCRFLKTNKITLSSLPLHKGLKNWLKQILLVLPLKKIKDIIESGRRWVLPGYAFNIIENFNFIFQETSEKISDKSTKNVLNSFSKDFNHIFDYGYVFFPEGDDYICPATHRVDCDYQETMDLLNNTFDKLIKKISNFFTSEELEQIDKKASKALMDELESFRRKYGIRE